MFSAMKLVSLLLITLFCPLALSQSNLCDAVNNCGECTRIKECVWCRQPTFTGNRCMARDRVESCAAHFVIDSQPVINYIQNIDLAKSKGSNDPFQLRPQNIYMANLRVGQTYSIPVEFMQAKDYPLDLYILMDLSNSMQPHKNNLERLSFSLAEAMRNKTKYLSMGFGSFVDKGVFPYSWPIQNSYIFKNHMSLNDNTAHFKEEVKKAKIMDTWDLPEGGFEALVQVMVCKQQLSWKEKARHIVIVATDNYLHLAGNGKLGGILTPNDGKCHLDSTGFYYTFQHKQDYPSLGLISRLAQDNAINIIFAVDKDTFSPYENFIPLIKGSTVRILNTNATNIVSLVKEQYDLITSSVELKDDNAFDGIKVRYFSSCLDTSNTVKENATCGGLKVGSLVKYNVTIEVSHCPVGKSSHTQSIVISPVGLVDSLKIDLEINCECPCERADNVSCSSQCHEISKCIECDPILLSDSYSTEKCLPLENYCKHLNMSKDDGSASNLFPLRVCETIEDTSGCRREFFYGFDEEDERRVLYGNKMCLNKVTLTSITFMIMGALVAVGLALLLVWRFLLYVYDQKEYARFLKDSKNAKWTAGNNPLYVDNTSKFTNPTFQESEHAKA